MEKFHVFSIGQFILTSFHNIYGFFQSLQLHIATLDRFYSEFDVQKKNRRQICNKLFNELTTFSFVQSIFWRSTSIAGIELVVVLQPFTIQHILLSCKRNCGQRQFVILHRFTNIYNKFTTHIDFMTPSFQSQQDFWHFLFALRYGGIIISIN